MSGTASGLPKDLQLCSAATVKALCVELDVFAADVAASAMALPTCRAATLRCKQGGAVSMQCDTTVAKAKTSADVMLLALKTSVTSALLL